MPRPSTPPPPTADAPDPVEPSGGSWLRDPEAIERLSLARIREEVELDALPAELHGVVLRLVYACALPGIVADLRWSGPVVAKARAALRAGAPVLCDVRMVAVGIRRRHLPCGNAVLCPAAGEEAAALARRMQTTRSAAGVELWRPHLHGAVVAIGNAPTALFQLLARLRSWPERPAAIFAFPVGFVGARESKQALVESGTDVPFLTLLGRFGGSALAAAAVNAVVEEGAA